MAISVGVNGTAFGLYRQIDVFADQIVSNLERVQGETLREFARRVRRDAIKNIQQGAKDSHYPQTGELADSIEYHVSPNQVTITAGNESTPYAALQEDPTEIELFPTHGKYLHFYWYKTGQWVTTKSVKRKGNEYLYRAFIKNIALLQAILDGKFKDDSYGDYGTSSTGRVYYNLRNAKGNFTSRSGK